ncbi:hypothetical protein ARSQ2_00010 [Arsenophonus endosymbiont of Bemisia tabaci Q2]|nr:hypothetical protein ARSQ2_00010 [Arsenophonus endosymbiont of Bemisia tabaci Q2]
MYVFAKTDMIKQIISSLTKQKVDTSTIAVSLIDILVEKPYYADTEISNWLKSFLY